MILESSGNVSPKRFADRLGDSLGRVADGAAGAQRLAIARFVAWLVVFGVGYFLTARLSQGLLFRNSQIGVVWVPNALTLSALILSTRRRWGAVLAVAAVAHVLAMSPSNPGWRMAWQISTNTLAAVGACIALRRLTSFPLRFDSRRELFLYARVVLVMPVLLALLTPAVVLSMAGIEKQYSPAIAFLRLALGNLSPLVLVTPAVVLWAQLDQRRLRAMPKRSVGEAFITIGSGLVVSILVLGSRSGVADIPWLLLLTFTPLIWAAVRLGPTGASTLLLLVGAVSIWGASRQLGPFVSPPNVDVVFSLQVFWIVIGPPVLLLAAVVREREIAEAARSTTTIAGVQVEAHIPPSVTRVRGDYVQLLQVLVNLIVNGCESMADVSAPNRVLRLHVEHVGNDRVEVLVGDSGVGLPANEEDRVFETFFTTKDDGLGLGLSIGRSIASVHGGRLWAENNTDRGGATFHFELPTFAEGLAASK